ncbi:3-keto-5-aminohexanoate cleavage protein [Bradyrhizobium sp. CIAT3101]|nr:3-keto-5-aminohexanoate cleavage protein [Bradyrhizobium sp. CIAT3101]WFU80506.1 3-keto-5-aminohexanoate cleavage protein [Bradyrhizobium sp. CIAT3101]
MPVTPEQIADSSIATTRAGAAAVHSHMRDCSTARGSRDLALYREAVKRIRNSDLMINLATGMSSDFIRRGVNFPHRSPVRTSGALEGFVHHLDLYGTAGSRRLATGRVLDVHTPGSVCDGCSRAGAPSPSWSRAVDIGQLTFWRDRLPQVWRV